MPSLSTTQSWGESTCWTLCQLYVYKYHVRTKRWYLKVFYHTVTMALVTSWLWYGRHCVLLNVKHVKLSVFQARVATALIETKRPVGRPSSSRLPGPPARKICKRKGPVDDVRKDGLDHLPDWAVRRERCQHCNAHAHLKCMKCDVSLCVNKDRNCFYAYNKA